MGRLSMACVALCTMSGACAPEYAGSAQNQQSAHEGDAMDGGSPGDAGAPAKDASEAGATATKADGGGDASIVSLDAGDAQVDAGPPNPCDLSGRWLVVTRVVSTALGGQQYIYRWQYYELAGSGESFAVKKGLTCGDGLTGVGLAPVNVSFEEATLTTMMKTDYTGRALTSVPRANACDVTMEKWYTIQGATVPYYLDPKTVLPTLKEKATALTPGWEDWDADGNPGITGDIKGTILGLNVTGEVFCAARQWTAMADTVPDVSKSFVGRVTWGVEQNVMSATGAGILSSAQATPVADPTLHIAEFVRLAPDQALGDDPAICSAIRKLAPTLATTTMPPP